MHAAAAVRAADRDVRQRRLAAADTSSRIVVACRSARRTGTSALGLLGAWSSMVTVRCWMRTETGEEALLGFEKDAAL